MYPTLATQQELLQEICNNDHNLSSLQYSLKDRELRTKVFKRDSVFSMNHNLLDDFHKCSSEFFVVFIQSLSNMVVKERN